MIRQAETAHTVRGDEWAILGPQTDPKASPHIPGTHKTKYKTVELTQRAPKRIGRHPGWQAKAYGAAKDAGGIQAQADMAQRHQKLWSC